MIEKEFDAIALNDIKARNEEKAWLDLKLLRFVAALMLAACFGCQLDRPPHASFAETLQRAQAGDSRAQYAAGRHYLDGPAGARDRAEAVKWFRQAADHNDAKAQTALGRCYLQGWGVAIDFNEAVKWLSKAEAQGEPDAHAVFLAFSLFELPFATNKPANAAAELRQLAGSGNAVAETVLGLACLQGKGLPRSDKEAAKWFQKAAPQGEALAQGFLADAYFSGRGVSRNYRKAARWARLAAEDGDPIAQEVLGLCYQDGKGVAKNRVEAVRWFRESANQNDDRAQVSLAFAYRHGEGVAQDDVQAYKWYERAALTGNTNAVAGREQLRRSMSAAQLAKAGGFRRRELTRFDRSIIDAHAQRYAMSCIPSAVEMTLKLMGRVPASYFEQQDLWQNKADGSFHDFDGKTIAGVTFQQQFTQAHGSQFPLAQLFGVIDRELQAGRFVIIGLPYGDDTHDWVIYDETPDGEFLAVSKGWSRTLENNHVRKTVTDMGGTDIGTYEVPP